MNSMNEGTISSFPLIILLIPKDVIYTGHGELFLKYKNVKAIIRH